MNPGLTRLRAHPDAENVRQWVLRDQQAALEAAAARGRNPAPAAPLVAAVPKRPPAAPLDDRKIVVIVSKNPKRGKAAQRFALYTPGMTVGQYKAAVGNAQGAADLRWDAKHGFIRID